jgi:TonB family protein
MQCEHCASRIVRKGFLVIGILLATFVIGTKLLVSQVEDQSSSERKVVTRVEPEYPATLKRLYIGGVVRVEADVAANGTVERTELLGGNPILGQSAIRAIRQWKYVPAGTREKLVVKLTFDPHR